MQITTTHRVKHHPFIKGEASLRVQVFIDNEPVGGEQVILSGKASDIEEFVAGTIDMVEIRRRWHVSNVNVLGGCEQQ